MIVSTWVHRRPYDLNIFQLKTLDPSYSKSVHSILCEKRKVLTDITGYKYWSLLTLHSTTTGPY